MTMHEDIALSFVVVFRKVFSININFPTTLRQPRDMGITTWFEFLIVTGQPRKPYRYVYNEYAQTQDSGVVEYS